jgi:hypothetical protein
VGTSAVQGQGLDLDLDLDLDLELEGHQDLDGEVSAEGG